MPYPTFTPPVSPSLGSNKPKVRVLKAEFGDGYSQRAADGLNHISDTFELSWQALHKEDAAEIEAFFKARGGHEPFLYSIPGEAARQFVCEEWAVDYLTDEVRAISATFVQSFML